MGQAAHTRTTPAVLVLLLRGVVPAGQDAITFDSGSSSVFVGALSLIPVLPVLLLVSSACADAMIDMMKRVMERVRGVGARMVRT